MPVKQEESQEETIQALQSRLDEITASNLLLQDQLARKEQFTAMIAHELRGPLSPIINYAQMLSRNTRIAAPNTSQNETTQRYVNIIISQAWRLTRLTNDLRDASRLTSGQFTLIREACDIVTLAKEMVEQLRPVAPYHSLVANVPSEPVIGNWDAERLQQVLGNLLDNATKYSDEHTTITVRIWTTSEMAHASVHNEGTSIPSSDIEMLFRPYTRLQGSTGRQGSGLGLYIAKSIIEAHGGTLRVEPDTAEASSNKLHGTTFSFDLPLG